MGLTNFFRRLSKREDEDVLERAEEQSHMSSYDRAIASEDYEAHKADAWTDVRLRGSEAEHGVNDFDSL